jgi:hypothetical protein
VVLVEQQVAFAKSVVAEGVHDIVTAEHNTVVAAVEIGVVEHETEIVVDETVKLGLIV